MLASILCYIIKNFLIEKKNCAQLRYDLINIYRTSPSYVTITRIVMNIPKVIAENLKEKYKHIFIGGDNLNVAVDESLFMRS